MILYEYFILKFGVRGVSGKVKRATSPRLLAYDNHTLIIFLQRHMPNCLIAHNTQQPKDLDHLLLLLGFSFGTEIQHRTDLNHFH